LAATKIQLIVRFGKFCLSSSRHGATDGTRRKDTKQTKHEG